MHDGTSRAKNSAIRFALSMSKRPRFSEGGSPGQLQGVHSAPVTGPLIGTDGGRTDTLPISVPAGSYVIPADVVSGIPGAEGNSLAGHAALTKMFASQPFMPDKAPYGAPAANLPTGRTIPGIRREEHSLTRAEGGKVQSHAPIPILAAGGEFVVHPDVVRKLGHGSLKLGHEVLDAFVKHTRKNNIKTLRKLPGPVRDGTK